MIYLCWNNHIRIKTRRRQGKICAFCHKTKRLLESYVFFTHKNKSHWSGLARRWIIDWRDYRWVCRDCVRRVLEEWRVDKKTKSLVECYLTNKNSPYGWREKYQSS